MQDFLPKPLLTPQWPPWLPATALARGQEQGDLSFSVCACPSSLAVETFWSLFWAQEWQALEKSRDKSDTLALGLVADWEPCLGK